MPERLLSFIDHGFMRQVNIRENLIRIPEIYEILSQAQNIWDDLEGVKSISFHNIFYRSKDFFDTHPELLDLLTHLVHLGILERLKGQNFQARYILTSSQTPHASMVFFGRLTLKDLVTKHPAVRSLSWNPQKIRLIGYRGKEKKLVFKLFCSTNCGLKLLDQSTHLKDLMSQHLENPISVLSLSWGHSKDFKKIIQNQKLQLQDFINFDKNLKNQLDQSKAFPNLQII